jgi:uncharacterized RDD family membrane protein YckC
MQADDQVITGEAVAIDMRLAGVGSRGIAALIDMAVSYTALFLLVFVMAAFDFGSLSAIITFLIVSLVLVLLGYPVAMETLWRGRTLGKAAMGLRVVRDDGGPIRFRHAFVRGAVGLFVDKPGITYYLGALIPMIATSRSKRLGDMAAGTVVVQDRVPGRIETPIMMPPPLATWAASLDLSGISDDLALRMRHFLGRAADLTPASRVALEHQLAAEATARVGAAPAGAPAWAVISAVLAERRRRAFSSQQPQAPAWPAHTPMMPAQQLPPANTGQPTAAPPDEPSPPTGGFVVPS